MSAEAEQPIIIVRRPRGGHDEHHGGAWKIAYADFMTAMMALFLVLWLVNASSEETKAAVASYFNPIELTDHDARPRGMDDPVDGSPGLVTGVEGPSEAAGTVASASPASPERADASAEDGLVSLRRDESVPDGMAASETRPAVNTEPERDDRAEANAVETGAGAARPFDPFALGTMSVALSVGTAVPTTADNVMIDTTNSAPIDVPSNAAREVERLRVVGEGEEPEANGAFGPRIIASASLPSAERSAGGSSDEPTNVAQPADATPLADTEPVPTPAAATAARAIARELADALASAEVEVVAEASTVIIRLADDPARGMFALGSAAPRAGLAGDLAKVAASLAGRPGPVSVHGHTDARPFAGTERGGGNWRLSAERAGAAHALLVAGGLDPARVARVVAHADRVPREADGLSPRNRRIEIRLATGGVDG